MNREKSSISTDNFLVVFLLCGCSNSVEETPKEEVSKTTEKEEVAAEPAREEQEEVAEPAEEEQPEQEEVAEETTTEMPEAEVTATATNNDEFFKFVEGLDQTTPHIVIWNKEEGYVINMGEGQHYQLKSNDRIFTIVTDKTKVGVRTMPLEQFESHYVGMEWKPDYSQFENPQEFIYGVGTGEDIESYLTCYFSAPVE